MELEKLEVLLEINTQRVAESINRVMPQIDGLLKRIEQTTGRSGKNVENNLDISDGTKKAESNLNDFVKNVSKQMDRMESIAKDKSKSTSTQIQSGFKQARSSAGKEVDLMVKDIEARMKQARAAQARVADLTSRRSASQSSGDGSSVIKYDNQIAMAEQQMTSYQKKAQELARTIKREFDAIPQSLTNIAKTMDANESQIETMRMKIANMQKQYETQRKVIGNFDQGFSTKDSPDSIDTMQKIQVQTARMNKLIASNDTLQRTYATTEDRTKMLRAALDRLGNSLDVSAIKTSNASLGMQTVAQRSDSARSVWSRFGGVFNRVSNNIAHGTRRLTGSVGRFFAMFNSSTNRSSKGLSNSGNQFNRYSMGLRKTIWMLGNQLIVFTLLYRGIMALGTGMLNSLKTNEQFASSLNQIKVNLLTAFYPIYQAILPALNAFMNAVARATGVMASFIATLFGTTYEAAKKGASGLYDNVKALEDTGSGASAAKEKVDELRSSLMGFDEINRIGLDVGNDDGADSGSGANNGTDFGAATGSYQTPRWLLDFADNVKSIMSGIFAPIKAAWEKHGQGVIDGFKYGLTEIWELVKSIGNSFMKVWSDGTGERIIGNILIIMGDIFTSVGNIANGLREAWENNDVGVSIFSTILGIVEDLTGHLKDMSKATEEWTRNLDFSPLMNSIDTLLQAVRPITDNIGAGLSWLYENVLLPVAGWTIEDAIPAFLDMLSGALSALDAIITALKPTFQWLWDEFLKPIAEWSGGVIVSIMEKLGDALSGIGDWINDHQDGFSDFVVSFVIFVATLKIINGLSNVFGILTGIFTGLSSIGGLSGIITLVGGAIKGVITAIGGPWALLAAGVAVGVTLIIRNWDKIKESAGKLGDWISDKWDGISTKTSEVWTSVSNWIKDKSDESRKKASENAEKLRISIASSWDTVKKKSSDTWTNVSNTVRDKAENARKWGSEKIDKLRDSASKSWDGFSTKTSTIWNSFSETVRSKSESARINAVNAFRNMGDRASEYGGRIKSAMGGAFDTVSGWASGFGTKVANGLRGGLGAIKSAAASIGNGLLGVIKSAVNGVIGGINWVLNRVGTSTRLATWQPATIKAYASGTDNHPGGMAMVNDGVGQHYQEAYEVNGKVGLFPKVRNMIVDLPKGAKVLDGKSTNALYGSGIPKYAGGVGNWLSKAWSGAKNLVGTVWDYISNPSKLLDIAISKFVNLSGAMEPALSIAKGGISTVASGATSFIKNFLDRGSEKPEGTGVNRWKSTIIRALNMNGLPTTSAYVNAWLKQISTESSGNENAIQSPQVVDINTMMGNPAKGLLQTIPQTFNAYKFPGHGNVFNGYHNALAAINYAKNRYGASGMLGVIGQGHGYENGGMVDKEGHYRLAEGNKKELIIPLERRNRALELLEVAKNYLGVEDDYSTLLEMPSLFQDDPANSFKSPPQPKDVGSSGISGMSKTLETLITQLATDSDSSEPIEFILEVDRTKLGKAVIKEINHRTKQSGKSPLNQ